MIYAFPARCTDANEALSMTEAVLSSHGAARMRTYRRRRRKGMRCVQIQIGPADIDRLIERGYLGPTEREDFEAIEAATSAFLSDALFAWDGLV
jgi:hypothetical protein